MPGNGPDLSVGAAWESYEAVVLPADAPPVQRSETKRAFYAGAWHALQVMNRIGSDDVTEEAGVEILGQMGRDIEAFYRGGG